VDRLFCEQVIQGKEYWKEGRYLLSQFLNAIILVFGTMLVLESWLPLMPACVLAPLGCCS
jgi:hypothetical protein